MQITVKHKFFNKSLYFKNGNSFLYKKVNKIFTPGNKKGMLPACLKFMKNSWYHIFVVSNKDKFNFNTFYDMAADMRFELNFFKEANIDFGLDLFISGQNLKETVKNYGLYVNCRLSPILINKYGNIQPFIQHGDTFYYDFC